MVFDGGCELKDLTITKVRVIDLRFPTGHGRRSATDAVNKDPDYSAAYCILETDGDLEGHGLTFTARPRKRSCAVNALNYLSRAVPWVVALSSITDDFASFLCGELTADSQFRWLGPPEKGVIHLLAAGVPHQLRLGPLCPG